MSRGLAVRCVACVQAHLWLDGAALGRPYDAPLPGQLADVRWARFNCITAVYPQNISSVAEDDDDSCELLRMREAGRLISLPVTEVQDHDRWHRLSFSVVITRFAVLAFSTPVCQRRRSTGLLRRRRRDPHHRRKRHRRLSIGRPRKAGSAVHRHAYRDGRTPRSWSSRATPGREVCWCGADARNVPTATATTPPAGPPSPPSPAISISNWRRSRRAAPSTARTVSSRRRWARSDP